MATPRRVEGDRPVPGKGWTEECPVPCRRGGTLLTTIAIIATLLLSERGSDCVRGQLGTGQLAHWARRRAPGGVRTTKNLGFVARAACHSSRRLRTPGTQDGYSADLSASNCSVKVWARLPAGLSSVPTEQPTKRPPSPSIGLGAESGDETRAVGTIGSVRQPCRGVSRLASTLGWPDLGGKPLRWRLSGDTDAMWLDRCGEDADRPVFHTLTEQLRPTRPGRVH